MSETNLYLPVKKFLEKQGFVVRGEVEGCDLVARKDDRMVVVELKQRMNLTLILQGIDRQKLTDWVYLAVPAPKNVRRDRWREIVRLCRLLGLGLLTVVGARRQLVEVICEPEIYRPRKNSKRLQALEREFEGRSGDFNLGGSVRRPVVTAYREEALRIAQFLRLKGPSKVAAIREHTDIQRAAPILQRNVYGWFQRVSRGVYSLTSEGEEALVVFEDVVSND